jgi:hypothetical protein
VWADPEPHDLISSEDADGTVIKVDARGVDRQSRMDLFELQARMLRIVAEESIRFPRLSLHLRR